MLGCLVSTCSMHHHMQGLSVPCHHHMQGLSVHCHHHMQGLSVPCHHHMQGLSIHCQRSSWHVPCRTEAIANMLQKLHERERLRTARAKKLEMGAYCPYPPMYLPCSDSETDWNSHGKHPAFRKCLVGAPSLAAGRNNPRIDLCPFPCPSISTYPPSPSILHLHLSLALCFK